MKNIFQSIFIVVTCSVILLSSCQSGGINDNAEDKIIRIAYLPITHSVAVMMMSELSKQTDSEYKIELARFSSWPEVVEALRANKVDGASMLFEVALQAQETDGGLTLLSLSHRGGNVVVVDNSIDGYRDLIGKNVAIPHKLSPQNTLLRVVMEREGLSAEDINIIEVSPAEMPFSMASGAVSAYVVAEPYGSVAESTKAGYILETSDTILKDSVCCGLFFRSDFISSHDGAAEWLDVRFNAAALETDLHKDNAADVFNLYSSFSDDVINNSLSITSYQNLLLSKEEYGTITEIILRYGVLADVPEYESFAYNR